MSAAVWGPGPVDMSLSRDNDGHRDYMITWLIKTTDYLDGPATVFGASGLPLTGSSWDIGNDSDSYALCLPYCKINPVSSSKNRPEKEKFWHAEQKFSTRPINRCQDDQVTNPLAEPQRISGSFCRFNKPVTIDRNGLLLSSSTYEPIEGVEKDSNRATVIIEQNVASLGLGTFTAMIDTLNDSTLWGLAARRIKLSNVSWERKLYGTCSYYYTRRFEFECRTNPDDLFDLDDVVDAGYKCLKGQWVGEGGDREWFRYPGTTPGDHASYVLYKEDQGENCPQKILLNGDGDPLKDLLNPFYLPTVELYNESNFLTLGIPTTL